MKIAVVASLLRYIDSQNPMLYLIKAPFLAASMLKQRIISSFPDEKSAIMLVAARLRYTAGSI